VVADASAVRLSARRSDAAAWERVQRAQVLWFVFQTVGVAALIAQDAGASGWVWDVLAFVGLGIGLTAMCVFFGRHRAAINATLRDGPPAR
jgi:hypothetical protein